MESFLLTTATTLNPAVRPNSLLSSLPSSASSFSSTLSNKVNIGRTRIGNVTKKAAPPIVASFGSKRGVGKEWSANIVADGVEKIQEIIDFGKIGVVASVPESVKEVSWQELQYPAGETGHRKPKPKDIDTKKQMDYMTKILSSTVYDVAIETQMQLAPHLSTQLGNDLWLKREDSQQVFSFKVRGAYNMMSKLSDEKLEKGVICASAGNHAQGVALSAKKLNTTAAIVMPKTTPQIKIDAVRRLGGDVETYGNSFDEAQERAKQRSEEEGLTFIPPFDDSDVIAGQGTVGMEISRQMRGNIHAIFVPIGGGGLVSGIASFFKLVYPHVKVFGVEPNDANSMAQALNRGEIVNVTDTGHFADGVAVQQVGEETYRICDELLDDVILVDKNLISEAIKDMFNDERSIWEPSGALSIAAAKAYCQYNNIKGENIVAVTSGANMNFDQLREISDLANTDQSIVATILPERPGSLQELTDLLDSDITEMTYRFSSGSQDAVVVYKVSAVGSELEALVEMLNASGFTTYTLSDNPVVTQHLRYMTGGRANVENEMLFRFNFPEKKGALKHFLKGFQKNWNISLFHHRRQGILSSDVLVGVQLEASEVKKFHDYIKGVGYRYEGIHQDDSAHILAKL